MTLVNDVIYFRYDKNFKMQISPLCLELASSQYEFKGLDFQYEIAGVFADSLPDSFGMKILDGYFHSTYNNFKPNIIDKLLFIGDVSLGALSYKPAIKNHREKNISIDLKDLKQHKKNILEKNTYSSIRIAIDMYKSFSPAGGARQKMILNYNEEKKEFYIGKLKRGDTPLIVKIDESEKPNDGVDAIIEYIYSKLATECEIDIPKTYLFHDDNGFKHFAIKRFDIDDNGERLHAHTLSGLLHMDKSKMIDYKDIMKIAKSDLGISQDDIKELFRRMLFNYVYNNNDEHLKNYSFLMDKKGQWRLSPAYDITYNNTNGQRNMMQKINGKVSNMVKYSDFEEIAKLYDIYDYQDVILKIQESVPIFKKLIEDYMDDRYKYTKMELLAIKELSE